MIDVFSVTENFINTFGLFAGVFEMGEPGEYAAHKDEVLKDRSEEYRNEFC